MNQQDSTLNLFFFFFLIFHFPSGCEEVTRMQMCLYFVLFGLKERLIDSLRCKAYIVFFSLFHITVILFLLSSQKDVTI